MKYNRVVRTEEEVVEASEEYFNRVWYARHTSDPYGRPIPEALRHPEGKAAADAIRERFPDVKAADQLTPHDLGRIEGKLSALRWALGADWDWLDT